MFRLMGLRTVMCGDVRCVRVGNIFRFMRSRMVVQGAVRCADVRNGQAG